MKARFIQTMWLAAALLLGMNEPAHGDGPSPLASVNQIHPSVFHLAYLTNTGTAFTVEVSNRQYLITADHVVRGITSGAENLLRKTEHAFRPYRVRPIRCANTNVDIIVLALLEQIAPASTLSPSAHQLMLGQDVFFFGYPLHGMYSSFGGEILPFVGKGVASAVDTRDRTGVAFYFHATNVRGFSGGPIVFYDPSANRAKICAVVKGFETVTFPVLKPDGPTDMEAVSNSGIMIGYAIEPAIEAIHRNPIGPPIHP